MKFKLYKKSSAFSKRLEDYVTKLQESGLKVVEVPVSYNFESPYEFTLLDPTDLAKIIDVLGFDVRIAKSEYGPYYNLTIDDTIG